MARLGRVATVIYAVRGGSWLDFPVSLRSAGRVGNPSVVRNLVLGFRVARTLTP